MRAPAVLCTSLAMILVFPTLGIAQEEKPDLIRSLSDRNQETRAAAARDLAKMGPAAKAAVPYLIKALKDPDLDVRVEVIHALGSIGPGAKDAIPDLFQVLKEEEYLFELLRHDERQLIACYGCPILLGTNQEIAIDKYSPEDQPKSTTMAGWQPG